MINLSSLNENQLGRIYIVANTPSYLFRHFRAEQSVQRLAKQNTAQDLIEFARGVAVANKRTLKQVIEAYAAIVALTFKDKGTIEIDPDSFNGLDWARSILAFASAAQIGTRQVELTSNPTLNLQLPKTPSGTSSQYVSLEGH